MKEYSGKGFKDINRFYSLGIDTSNYTTSVAVVDNTYSCIIDKRIILDVAYGQRGLRQSDAVFKHIENFPVLMKQVFSQIDADLIECIAVSTRPRPVEHSYMPVFKCGQAFSQSIASALNCLYFEFSHQEGHIKAGNISGEMEGISEFIVVHISGGTTEVLSVQTQDLGYNIEIIGGSKDISMGQLIDRMGVRMGFPFPSGKYLDEEAYNYHGKKSNLLKKVHVDGTDFNLSGIETQCLRLLEENQMNFSMFSQELFDKVSEALKKIIINAVSYCNISNVLLVGGVASSKYIRNEISASFNQGDIHVYFGLPKYASDNAAGIAALGMDRLNRVRD